MARILFVHGAFAGAWCWEPVLEPLRERGHTVQAIDLPGSGQDPTPAAEVTLDGYAKRICQALAEGPPALLAGQSMGGMAISQAAAHCPGRVVALLYIGAFAPHDGQSLMDLVAYPEAADDEVQKHLVVQGDVAVLPPDRARPALFGCCAPKDAEWAAQRLGPQPIAAFQLPFHLGENADAYARIPRAYIVCGQDRAIPPAMQRRMIDGAGFDPVLEIDADHWPWLSRTEEFLAAVEHVIAGVPGLAPD